MTVVNDLIGALERIENRARAARKGFEEHVTVNGRTALWDCEAEARYALLAARPDPDDQQENT